MLLFFGHSQCLIYRPLWMLLEREMRDGCSKCEIIGEMKRRRNSSSSKMRKKRNVIGYLSTEN
jgi:hypothetical protein